jgi:hypothetical protein
MCVSGRWLDGRGVDDKGLANLPLACAADQPDVYGLLIDDGGSFLHEWEGYHWSGRSRWKLVWAGKKSGKHGNGLGRRAGFQGSAAFSSRGWKLLFYSWRRQGDEKHRLYHSRGIPSREHTRSEAGTFSGRSDVRPLGPCCYSSVSVEQYPEALEPLPRKLVL